MLYQYLIRPLLFRLTRHDAEVAHMWAMKLLAIVGCAPPLVRLIQQVWAVQDQALERTVFGVRFPNPLGLAAGFDKDGEALPIWAALGFGFVEAGTVTWHAQPGNTRPRLFRLPADEALINRMGFNNHGAAALAQRLQAVRPLSIPIGVSLGKSRQTPLDSAIDDYCASFRLLHDHADYIAINVSSPNTPGLRALQDRAQLDLLLAALRQAGRDLVRDRGQRSVPLLVKIAPDLSEPAIGEVLDACAAHHIDGIIATNTTLNRSALRTPIHEAGGLSGRPLAETALRVVRFVNRETAGRLPIIGVGGIFSADDACRMFDVGASLVQVYTGFVYHGPRLTRSMNLTWKRTK